MCVIKNKTILVTGGAGFVGSYVLEQLLEEDVKKIIVIDNFVRGSRKNIETSLASGKVRLIEGDICNRDFITPLFKDVDYCFHLAGLADIVPSINNPSLYFQHNVTGTLKLIESLKLNTQLKKLKLDDCNANCKFCNLPLDKLSNPTT